MLNDGNFGAGIHAGAGGGSGQRRAAGSVGGRQQDTDPGADLAGESRKPETTPARPPCF